MTTRIVIPLIAATVLGLGPAAYAEVPTAADFAACNMIAAEKTGDTASASPPQDVDRGRTPDGRAGDPTGKTITGSPDPQLEGLAADRASDPAYVAAYRTCMRQKGF